MSYDYGIGRLPLFNVSKFPFNMSLNNYKDFTVLQNLEEDMNTSNYNF